MTGALAGSRRGLSPRGRGNRPDILSSVTGHRSIPAWAGEPWAPHGSLRQARVYPRVGGGTRYVETPTKGGTGPIPAWAGEPSVQSRNQGMPGVYPRVGGGTHSTDRQAG